MAAYTKARRKAAAKKALKTKRKLYGKNLRRGQKCVVAGFVPPYICNEKGGEIDGMQDKER